MFLASGRPPFLDSLTTQSSPACTARRLLATLKNLEMGDEEEEEE